MTDLSKVFNKTLMFSKTLSVTVCSQSCKCKAQYHELLTGLIFG